MSTVLMSTVLSPTNKPPLHSRSGSQTARLASGIHLGIGPWSQTRDSKAVGGVECGPPCLPPEAPAGSRWLQCPQGGWAQRPRPQPSPGGTVQRPQAWPWWSHDMSSQDGPGAQAGSPPTHQPFGHPGRPLVSVASVWTANSRGSSPSPLSSKSTSPHPSNNVLMVAQRAAGTINSPAS